MYCLKKQAEGVNDQWTGASPGAGPDPLISKPLSSLLATLFLFQCLGVKERQLLKGRYEKIRECLYAKKSIKTHFQHCFYHHFEKLFK